MIVVRLVTEIHGFQKLGTVLVDVLPCAGLRHVPRSLKCIIEESF